MTTTDLHPPPLASGRGDRPNLLVRAEAWLDDRGRWAWIAAMVLGFIAFWPLGLAILAYMIWSKRMFSSTCRSRDRHATRDRFHAARNAARASGNAAFDAYKAETLRRLEDEQQAFEDFLARLRAARDKAEFDQFMDERARRGAREDRGTDDQRDEGPVAL